ncbi:MAG: hypothetical protein H6555_07505 [Lewinellaceae bacterium]|nr:hypothetical protein [Lewinellaceae bacterium]
MKRLRASELMLLELIIYIVLWLNNDYLASLVSIIFGSICLAILIISLLVEWIERSKVPRWYYYYLAVSILAPIIAWGFYRALNGEIPWTQG